MNSFYPKPDDEEYYSNSQNTEILDELELEEEILDDEYYENSQNTILDESDEEILNDEFSDNSLSDTHRPDRLLGEGNFGKVINYRQDRQNYALKFFMGDSVNPNWLASSIHEIDVLFRVRNPFLVRGWEIKTRLGQSLLDEERNPLFRDVSSPMAVMEDLKIGSLDEPENFEIFHTDGSPNKEIFIMKFLTEISSAIECLYNAGYINADIKLGNILYQFNSSTITSPEDVSFFMGDYGLCLPRKNVSTTSIFVGYGTVPGTPMYTPNRVRERGEWSKEDSYWSLALSALELAVGKIKTKIRARRINGVRQPINRKDLDRTIKVAMGELKELDERKSQFSDYNGVYSLILDLLEFKDGTIERISQDFPCEYSIDVKMLSPENREMFTFFIREMSNLSEASSGQKIPLEVASLALALAYRLDYDLGEISNKVCLTLASEFFRHSTRAKYGRITNEVYLTRALRKLGGQIFYYPFYSNYETNLHILYQYARDNEWEMLHRLMFEN